MKCITTCVCIVLFIAPPRPDSGSPEPQVLEASLREEEGQGRVGKYTNPL